MKVLHVIPGVAPRYGGPSVAVVEMCRSLQRLGIEVLAATTNADGPDRLEVDLGRPVLHRDVPTIFFSRQWSESFKYSGALAAWLDDHVECFDVAHIHAVFSHSSYAAARACRRQGVPYVVRPLGSLDPWSLRQKKFRKWVLWQITVKDMLEGATAIHYTTAAEKRLAEDALKLRRGVVIPLGIEEEAFGPQSGSRGFRDRYSSLGRSPYVLVLCRLHPKKGLELVIDAFLRVMSDQRFCDWRLMIAGDGEPAYVRSLKKRACVGTSQGRVLFTGWLENGDKIAALHEAAVVALISRQENLGLSVIEGMACGVPVLVSEQVNLSEEIRQECAGWVVSTEPASVENVLLEVLAGDEERLRRGRSGRDYARRRFRWSAVAVALKELYQSVSVGGAGGATHSSGKYV